ncbi:hypothetical protein [Pseudarthrobacter sp. fls2-241-R2A-168]|uniref:hypothetical protein n=1 Tax=Pseudarthrobacter sp. fls2-241-R2A-168 TaxID=3040304 RepID=UPI002554DF96|nr:hypothetical protein [Pseudarthrobacter sp. fls2-241-R2A-168]
MSGKGDNPPVANTLGETVSANFKMIVIIIFFVTVACGVGNLWMALGIPTPTDPQKDVMATMSTLWKMGFGSLVGLVGAKAA